jgi:ankyrin repeat protein
VNKSFIEKYAILFFSVFLSSCSVNQSDEGDPELMKLESQVGSQNFNPNQKYLYGDTLLHKEAHRKFKKPNFRIMQNLVKLGANVNGKNDNDDTPLHVCRDLAAAKLLVKNGADLNAVNKQGYTPLDSICDEAARLAYFEHDSIDWIVDVVEYLLNLGANFSKKFKLANLECKRLVLLVLEHGGNIHLTLFELRNPKMIKFLVNSKLVDINEVDKNEKTPLHIAVEYGWSESVEALLECGMKGSHTLLEFAKANEIANKDEIIKLLQKHVTP